MQCMVDKLLNSLCCSTACGHNVNIRKTKLKAILCSFFLLYPWAFSKFAFNHRILAMIFLTGNFLNAVDRDGLHGSLLDPMLLCASDKTRFRVILLWVPGKIQPPNNSPGNMDGFVGAGIHG